MDRQVWAVSTTVLEAVVDRAARKVEVTVIRPGLSDNGLRYEEGVLEASVPLWDGAPAFADHPGVLDRGRAGGRSVRDLVGVYGGSRYVAGRGVVSELRLYPAGTWVVELVEAYLADVAAGRKSVPLGVSADMVVEWQAAEAGGKSIRDVRRVVRVCSADVVMHPSAGGRFDRILEGMEGQVPGEVDPLRVQLCGAVLDARLGAVAWPAKAKEFVRDRFKGRVFEAAELDGVMVGMTGVLAEGVAGSVVSGNGHGRMLTRVGLSSRERVQVALDRLFGIEPPDHLKDTPRLSGIREAYIAITGDRGFTGRIVREESVLEANEVTTSVMADALMSSLTKRLVMDYKGQARWWEPIVTQVGMRDLRVQDRILLNDFAALSTVAENGAYTNLAWGDTKESYTPGKKGNLVYVTMEAIINDDVGMVTRIPSKLAIAATVTINELVSALFTVNSGSGPVMTDGFNVFDATNHQGNKGTTALSVAELQVAMVVLAKMTNSATKRIGVVGKYLLVPPDLMYAAQIITGSPLLPGSPNNDINPLAGRITPIVVPQWTDTNNWYLLAAPAQIECMEVGFLGGRAEPELLVQDNPTDGSVFTNDAISFKVRHIYGAGWQDYRGAYGAVVA